MDKKLKGYEDIFGNSIKEVIDLKIETLDSYPNHPFKLYIGERLEDMKKSVLENGVMVPIIVRSRGSRYQILSGHNRVNAARLVGLKEVQAIVYDHIADEEALMIVTETNFMQRSFSDMAPSEKAKSLKIYYDMMKSQGKRTDLMEGVNDETCSHVGYKLKTIEVIGNEYGLSKNSIARILRLNHLIPELLEKVDNGQLPMMAAVHLSYLDVDEQVEVLKSMDEGNQVSVAGAKKKKDEQLFMRTSKKSEAIKAGNEEDESKSIRITLELTPQQCLKFFKGDQSLKKMNTVILSALESYCEQ